MPSVRSTYQEMKREESNSCSVNARAKTSISSTHSQLPWCLLPHALIRTSCSVLHIASHSSGGAPLQSDSKATLQRHHLISVGPHRAAAQSVLEHLVEFNNGTPEDTKLHFFPGSTAHLTCLIRQFYHSVHPTRKRTNNFLACTK